MRHLDKVVTEKDPDSVRHQRQLVRVETSESVYIDRHTVENMAEAKRDLGRVERDLGKNERSILHSLKDLEKVQTETKRRYRLRPRLGRDTDT